MRANPIRAAVRAPRAFHRAKNRSEDIRVHIAERPVDITPMWDGARQREGRKATGELPVDRLFKYCLASAAARPDRQARSAADQCLARCASQISWSTSGRRP
jgi:hypothetical protein